MHRRWILFAGSVARMKDMILPKSVVFGELMGRGLHRRKEKECTRCLVDHLRALSINADQCSPGRGGIAQDDGTRDGTFHGEMDRCRESQDWTAACSNMPERCVKGQREHSPIQAWSCWFVRHI